MEERVGKVEGKARASASACACVRVSKGVALVCETGTG